MPIVIPSTSRAPTMVSPTEAYRIVQEAAAPLPARCVPLLEALGRPLAETIRADRNYPPFRRAMMDGYAVTLASAGQTLDVVGQQAAGITISQHRVTSRACVEIMTGAACPIGTEAVVQKEHVRRENGRVTLPAAITPGGHIAEAGSECAAGEVILAAGDVVTPLAVAVLASIGRQEVAVSPSPRMAVIVTGEELVSGLRRPREGQIRDSNGPMLMALAIQLGLALPACRLVGDDRDAIRRALDEATACDLVVLSGGVSAGAFDFVPEVLIDSGAEILFRKVVQKPGKPLLAARKGARLIFGLPGNPLACHFCFCRYVQAAVRRMGGGLAETSSRRGRLAAPLRPDRGRTHFVPAMVEPDPSSPLGWEIRPLPGVSSADIFHSHQANAYAEVPPGGEELPVGASVSFTSIAGPNPGLGTPSYSVVPTSGG